MSTLVTFKGKKAYIPDAKGTGGMLLVKMNWCHFCVEYLPEYIKTSEAMGRRATFPFYVIEGTENENLVNQLGVQGFPSLFFINLDGSLGSRYQGPRDQNTLVRAISDRYGI